MDENHLKHYLNGILLSTHSDMYGYMILHWEMLYFAYNVSKL